MKIQYKQSDKDSRFLQPMGEGNGFINVLDMAWTLSPKSSRKEVPYLSLTEYQQTTGQLIASIIYYGRVASRLVQGGVGQAIEADRDPFEVYKYKYFAEPTGFSYKIPYFSSKKFQRGNSFGYDDGENPFSKLTDLGRNMKLFPGSKGGTEGLLEGFGTASIYANALLGLGNTLLPGKIGFETPKSWSETDTETYEVTFDLFNTGTIEDIENNRNLCHILSYQNSPSRRNFAIIDPPVIYSLSIPDVVHMPACYVSNLTINNLGNTRTKFMLHVDGSTSVPRTIPEAYRITIQFTSLLMPTRNILLALDKGKNIEAISDIAPFKEEIDNISGQLVDTVDFNSRQNTGGPNSPVGPQNSISNILGSSFTNLGQ
jgi:hypothetical protein